MGNCFENGKADEIEISIIEKIYKERYENESSEMFYKSMRKDKKWKTNKKGDSKKFVSIKEVNF